MTSLFAMVSGHGEPVEPRTTNREPRTGLRSGC